MENLPQIGRDPKGLWDLPLKVFIKVHALIPLIQWEDFM